MATFLQLIPTLSKMKYSKIFQRKKQKPFYDVSHPLLSLSVTLSPAVLPVMAPLAVVCPDSSKPEFVCVRNLTYQ